MNTATTNLENDHVNILRLISVIEKIIQTNDPEIQYLESIINLIKDYADGFHHMKEENMLFPLMISKGFSKDQGPIAVMLHEHAQGREYVKGMSVGMSFIKEDKNLALASIYENMRAYCLLLRNHIEKENNILFRMADNLLTPEENESLLKEFKRVENSNFCGGVLQDCIKSIEMLELKYS
jgi:hemerythrin-like domain-containing protein